MADKQQHYKNLSKLLAVGFFICGIIPILIIATTSIYNSKQVAIKEYLPSEYATRRPAMPRRGIIPAKRRRPLIILATQANRRANQLRKPAFADISVS